MYTLERMNADISFFQHHAKLKRNPKTKNGKVFHLSLERYIINKMGKCKRLHNSQIKMNTE